MRGGKRPGAGRPTLAPENKRVQMSLSVSQETRQWMRTMAEEQGLTTGQILELLIETFEDSCNR